MIVSRRGRIPSPEDLINGALGGLVGITASANCVSSVSAVLIGIGSAICVLLASRALIRFKLDDVVGAIPVHLAAGIWGTLAVGPFGDPEILGSSLTRWEQTLVQLMGIIVVGLWVFGIGFVLLKVINRFYPLRVSKTDELIGLNISEHGATSELYDLIAFMKYQSDTGNLASDAPTDQFTETGVIGMAYNHVMDTLRRNEEMLKTTNDKLKSANEDLHSYDHVVAHDLSNPISVIRSYAALIDEEDLDDSERQQYMAGIRRSSEDALEIIRELLNFAKSGSENKSVEKVNIHELVYQANAQLHPLIKESGANFELDLELNEVSFNGFALQQVMVNLISNAAKYSAPNRAPVITIRSRREDNADVIEVEDNGIGMDESQMDRAFVKHNRLRVGATKADGHGIGLYTVKRLVESGGGKISVRSRIDQGTIFSLHLKKKEVTI